jgi:hypothetical protein
MYSSAWANHIADSPINDAIANWHAKQPEREQDCATPSSMLDCPRVVWLKYRKNVKPPIPLGWGKLQRMLHGRVFENTIAEQLKEDGKLLWHWRDDTPNQSVKFEMGKDLKRVCGTPDLLLKIDGKVLISDAKTSMGKSFAYVPLTAREAFEDYMWFKYQLQVETYYMLAQKNPEWFKENKLPLPELCNLFSYALDDGVVRRDFTWKPTQQTAAKILYYVTRWNKAYASEDMPDCTCQEFDGTPMKFCYYQTEQVATKTGYKLGTRCCGGELYETTK